MSLFKKREKLASIVVDYRKVFASEEGRSVLLDIVKRGHFFATSYNGNVNDMLFREGERNIVNQILLLLDQDPMKILEEIKKQEKKEREYDD